MVKLPVPEVGTSAPEFSAKNQKGKVISLNDLRGKKVILYFYPMDDTPGCTKEACSLRDNFAEIQKHAAVILGVSMDPETSHRRFIDKFNLPFDLLVDSDRKIINAYGAYGERNLYGNKSEGILRYTFIIDEAGIIQKVFKKVNSAMHGEEVLQYI